MQIHLYPVIQGFIVFCVMIVVLAMVLRLIVNYLDPNPFGKFGRLCYQIKKRTDRFVFPVSKMLSRVKIDIRLSPLVVMLGFIVVAYFVNQLTFNLFYTIDGVASGIVGRSITKIVGYLLYGFLGIYSLFIVIRIILSWITTGANPVSRFFIKLTDPILEPFRRFIPPLGMFDISPILVLFLLNFLQAAVRGVFLLNP
jgi:YggT family protein